MAREPITQELEAAPEADRLGAFPHPRMTKHLFGHDAIVQMLAEAGRGGRMHHGWLLSGPEGVGKATLAYHLARFLLAPEADRDASLGPLGVRPTSTAQRQVAALSHPGLLLLRRPWDSKTKRHAAGIPIDEVRRLRMFLGHAAEADAWRVVLVDTADDLAAAAANAILKSLEEPPPRTVFILISSEPGRLLPTIRSRCRRLDLEGLNDEDLKRAAQQAIGNAEDAKVPEPSDWAQLLYLAQGSARRALAVSSSGGLTLYTQMRGVVELLPKLDWAAVHKLSDELAGTAAEQKFEAFYEFLLDLLAQLIRTRATGIGPDIALAKRLIPDGQLPRAAEAWSEIVAAKAQAMALNLDRKALIMATVEKMAVVARG
ncbi:MAG: DNA polymerase III subunit delta' [Hyphomicrobiaceae bacterium]